MSSATYWWNGAAAVPLAIFLTLGGALASRTVVKFATRLGDVFLRRLFGCLLLLLSPVMLLGLQEKLRSRRAEDSPVLVEEEEGRRSEIDPHGAEIGLSQEQRISSFSHFQIQDYLHFLGLGVLSGAVSAAGISPAVVCSSFLFFFFFSTSL